MLHEMREHFYRKAEAAAFAREYNGTVIKLDNLDYEWRYGFRWRVTFQVEGS